MNKLDGWLYGNHVVLLIKYDCTEQKKNEYLCRKGIKLYLDGDCNVTIIDDQEIALQHTNRKVLNIYHSGDILSISETGNVSLLYSEIDSEIDVFMTNKCNSNCVMCPLSENVRRRYDEEHDLFLDEYIDLLPEDIGYINVTGGEPTLYSSRFISVMQRLTNKFQNSDFQLLTNGRSFADKNYLLETLNVCPSGIRFAVPLHSADEDIHDSITRSKNSFRQTDAGIRNLLALQQKVEIRVVISKRNINTLLATAEYIVNKYSGVFCVNFIGMEMMGNASVNREELWVDYQDAFNNAKKAIDTLVKNGIDVQLYNFPLCAVEKGYWYIAAKSITEYKVRYMDECEGCEVKEICGGFFYSTKQVMQPKVIPIKRNNEI